MSSKTAATRPPHNHAAAQQPSNAHVTTKQAALAAAQQQSQPHSQSQSRLQQHPAAQSFAPQQSQQPPQPLVIYPGVGLGPFRLGASIGAVLSLLQSSPHLTACGPAAATKLTAACSPLDPTSVDLSLEVGALGVRLRFEPTQQRLHLIDVFDATRSTLVYMRTPLTSPAGNGAPPTFTQLSRLFGPTYPGSWTPHDPADEDDGETEEQKRGGGGGDYTLQYPGVAMVFPLSSSPLLSSPAQHSQQQQPQHAEVVVEMPDGSSPPLSRLFIHSGPVLADFASALPPLSGGDTYFEPLEVILGQGVYFEHRKAFISFDSRAQDLLAMLGAPQHVFIKDEKGDKMAIHRGGTTNNSQPGSQSNSPLIIARTLLDPASRTRVGSASLAAPPPTPDYFFNYFLLGLDLLLDGVSHRVKKVILHTNLIDRPDFGRYARANFWIQAPNAGPVGAGEGKGGRVQGGSGPSLLELPPTATQRSHSGSMLHASPSLDSLPPLGSSPPQSISIPMPSNDATAASGGKKKKKKGALAAASAATESKEDGADNAASGSSVAAAPSSFLHRPPPSPSPAASAVTFSPSLSPSVLPLSQATVITPVSKVSLRGRRRLRGRLGLFGWLALCDAIACSLREFSCDILLSFLWLA